VKTNLDPRQRLLKLLLELLLVVAVAEIGVMLILPILAPNADALSASLLDVSMLVLLAGPALYWRLATSKLENAAEARSARAALDGSNHAIKLAATTQVIGLLLTAGGVWWQAGNLDTVSHTHFTQSVERIDREVTRRLNLPLNGLKSARAAISANNNFKRRDFRTYVSALDLRTDFPGIRGFGFIRHVPRSGLARFEAAERADGAPTFAVQTKGNAPDLYVITYLEPLPDNVAALGYDIGQSPERRAAAEYAARTGEATLLAGISLMQDAKQSPGMLMLLPVYRPGIRTDTLEERQSALLGLLYVPIVASELLDSVTAVTEERVDFELFDGVETTAEQLIFDADGILSVSGSGSTQTTLPDRSFSNEQRFIMANRLLTLRVSSGELFDGAQDRSSLVLIGLGGTLVSFLMAISVWLLAAGKQRANALAESMTQELDRMAQVVQHTDNAVTIMGRDMRIKWVNQGFSRITGYSFEEAKGKTPGELLSCGNTDPETLHILEDSAVRGVACRVQLVNRSRSGLQYWADTEVQPMLDKNGRLVGFMEIGTDVSIQKQTQHQLEAAMRESRALLDTVETHSIVSSTDANGNITDVNEAFCQISGYSREELIGQDHRILRSGAQSAEFWTQLWQTIGSGKPWRGEICNRAKDGTLYWVDSMIAPFVGEDGRIEKYVSIRTNITERRQSAERLRQSEATLAATFQDAATGMATFTPKGQWLMTNPALCDFLGLSRDELNVMTFMDVSHPEEWDTDQEQMQRLLDGEIPVYQRAKRYLHRDGHTVWGLASVSVVRADDGQPEFMIAHIVDITARKRAEEALRLSNALMEESQAVARVGGWEFNLDTNALYWTREVYRIHETSPDDYHPSVDTAVDFYMPESRALLDDALQFAMDQGQGFDLELEVLTAKGTQIDVRATGSATLENGRVVRLSGILQDITERKQYELSLKEAREKAELATQSKGQFLANMSHEIRTPMNAILGMLRLLHNTELNQRQRDYAAKTENAAKSLLGLINDILDFSKVEAGKMQLDPQPFRVKHLMRNLSVILSSNLGAKGVEVLFDVDPNVPDVLLGDAMRLQQVLINLGGNAVKFTSQGEVVVALRLIGLQDEAAEIEFAVQDSGIGIAPENQAHIFTGFSQAEASTTRKFGGTGLGLAISQRMVELMGGELRLHSTLGQGSTFAFNLRLPLVRQVPPELQEAEPVRGPERRVLVVDSNAVARDLLARMVRSWNWPCTVAASGEAALALAEQGAADGGFPYDVVYLSWHLSGMDGWDTAARLRQLCAGRHEAGPVLVMVSGNSREALEQRTMQEQNLLNGFLVKPVTASMLLEAAQESSTSHARIRQTQRHSASQRRLSGMRILVVEDNLINQQVAEELLAAEGALVSLAANGQLGVDAIAAAASGQQFDAVLMDIQMPVLDGFAATRMVREQLKLDRLPIIAMTANAMASDRDDCLAAGMNDHVGKPFDLKALVQTLITVTGFQAHASDARGSTPVAAPAQASDGAGDLLDVAAALDRMGGLKALYARAARDFVAALPAQLVELRSAVSEVSDLSDATDTARCRMLAHTLKGTAAMLGAVALSEVAAHLEKQCQSGTNAAPSLATLERLDQLAQATVAQLQQAAQRLEATLQPPAAATPNHIQRDGLQRLMAQLAEEDFAALETFAELRGSLADVPPARLLALEQALQDLDMPLALQACQAVADWLQIAPEKQQPVLDT